MCFLFVSFFSWSLHEMWDIFVLLTLFVSIVIKRFVFGLRECCDACIEKLQNNFVPCDMAFCRAKKIKFEWSEIIRSSCVELYSWLLSSRKTLVTRSIYHVWFPSNLWCTSHCASGKKQRKKKEERELVIPTKWAVLYRACRAHSANDVNSNVSVWNETK